LDAFDNQDQCACFRRERRHALNTELALPKPRTCGSIAELLSFPRTVISQGPGKYASPSPSFAARAGVLGFRKLALIGNSYGTRVAFTILRDYPDLAASAVLDAATPPEVDLFETAPATSERAFSELQKACGEDPECAIQHPDLRQALDNVLSHLTSAPSEMVLHPIGSKEAKLRLTPALFIGVLMQCFVPPLLPAIPALVDAAANGNYAPFITLLEYLVSHR